jgi:hypothetical protein
MTKQRIMNDTEHILLDSKQTADITHRIQREITLTPHYYTVRVVRIDLIVPIIYAEIPS